MNQVGKNGQGKQRAISMMHNVEKNLRHLLQLRYGIIGDSSIVQKAIETLEQVAPTDISVLITGETGTGKEVFANAIHGLSNRKKFPFVSVNCGAIPETLLESELFGHEKGAFTGAVEQRKGFFEAADKGTIFLDEIGEMPLGTQVKLLRVLENGQFSRLGSSDVRRVDVRIIAATNRNLEKESLDGKFRQDLFFRLNSVHIKLPPLREHLQDIPLLVDFFAERITDKLKIQYDGISSESLAILQSLPWTGNTRELRNLIETLVTIEKGAYITPVLLQKYIPRALPEYKFRSIPSESSLIKVPKTHNVEDNETIMFRTLLEIKNDISDIKRFLGKLAADIDGLYQEVDVIKNNQINIKEKNEHSDLVPNDFVTIAELEKMLIINTLQKLENNRRKAANALGISERTLYRKIDEYKIDI